MAEEESASSPIVLSMEHLVEVEDYVLESYKERKKRKSGTIAMTSIGFLVLRLPASPSRTPSGGTLSTMTAFNPSGKKVNAVEQHIKNILNPSTPLFFNTLNDPYCESLKILFVATISVSVKVFQLLFLMACGLTFQIMMHLHSL